MCGATVQSLNHVRSMANVKSITEIKREKQIEREKEKEALAVVARELLLSERNNEGGSSGSESETVSGSDLVMAIVGESGESRERERERQNALENALRSSSMSGSGSGSGSEIGSGSVSGGGSVGVSGSVSTTVPVQMNDKERRISDSNSNKGNGGGNEVFSDVIETRLTGFVIHASILFSLLLLPFLGNIPIPVISGIFLYLGKKMMKGNLFLERLGCTIIEKKLLPKNNIFNLLPTITVMKYLIVKSCMLALIWFMKQNKNFSLFFPSCIAFLMIVRTYVMPNFFSKEDLILLDPEM